MKLLQAMKRSYMKKRMLAATLVAVLAFANYPSVFATSIDDAQRKKNEAQQQMEELNNQIDSIQAAQSDLQEEMEAYDDQLMALLTDMNLLEADMANLQVEIDQANIDLAVAKEVERTQYEAMKVRIQYMYENGDKSVWTAVMEADSMTDLLNRVEYVSEVYDYDRQQLETYQATVQQVTDLTVALNEQMAEMEELEISYQEQQDSLEAVIAEKSAEMGDFENQLLSAQSLADNYAETIRQQNQIIAAEQARRAAEAAAAANAAAGSVGGSGSATGLTDSGLNPAYKTNVSGSDVVAFASQYVGYPYVYGGTSLTQGSDCSYFVMACFQNFGISVPRNSYSLQSVGQAVSYDCAQAGDIICYSGHVAIYMGNGQIVHASSPTKGICYGTATYRTILTIRRVL